VYDIEKGNTNDEIKFYMGYNEEKGKSYEDSLGLRILYFIWLLGASYYQGGYIGWASEVQILESSPQTKNPSGIGHIRSSGQIPEALAEHVRSSAQTFLGLFLILGYPSLSGSLAGF
jgi:hypothetical protein